MRMSCGRAEYLPEIRGSAMLHLTLKRLNASVLFVFQSAVNGFIQASGGKVGLNASINSLRMVLVKPRVQFPQLLRCEHVYSARNLLYRVYSHGPLRYLAGQDCHAGPV